MLQELIFRHLVTIFMILLFSIKLWTGKKFRGMETRFFWVTVISCIVLVQADMLELFAASDPSLRFLRILMSVIGYTIRSVAALSLLLVIAPKKNRGFPMWIPSLITMGVSCTAFFSDVAFGFDESYEFYRGPLGYVAYIVPILYLLLILWTTFTHISERNGVEKYIIPVCAIFGLTSAIVDSYAGGIRLNEAIMISSVFLYIVLYSHDNRRDPLTGLLNRQAYYDDCNMYGKIIGAVASLDMNGLKELNDTKGHHAGDKALSGIGKSIREASDQNTQGYRIGGDEFLVLYYHEDEEKIVEVNNRIRQLVADKGYSISIGYAMLDDNKNLDAALKASDKLMYEDKERFYEASGRGRRAR